MSTFEYRNPDADVARAFAPIINKMRGMEQLNALREEIRHDVYDVSPELCSEFEAETNAFETAISELGRSIAKASDPRRREVDIRQILKETTGLQPGMVCSFPGHPHFRLEHADLLITHQYGREPCRLLLRGPRLRANGTPYLRGATHAISFDSLDDIRTELGMPRLPAPAYAGKNPADMSADELRAEIEGAFTQDGWLPDALRGRSAQIQDILSLLDAAKCEDTSALWTAGGPLSFTLDVNVKDNLWIHCVRDFPRGQDGKFHLNWLWHLRMWKPDGLTIHDFAALMRPWKERYPGIHFETVGQCARMHAVLVHAAEKAVNGYTDMLRTKYQPVWAGARVVVCLGEDSIPFLKIACRLTNEWRLHQASVLTDFDEQTLIEVVPRFPWRAPTADEAAKWVASVLQAGGDDPSQKDPDWLAHVVDFYEQHDPETIARHEQEAAARRLEQEQARDAADAAKRQQVDETVREILRTSTIAHGTGWRQLVAQAAGISVQKVKAWLQRRLPDEFEKIYGEPASGVRDQP